MQEDTLIRFEVIMVLGHQKREVGGISDLLYDAKILYDFIKEGKEINHETVIGHCKE